jgi:lipopolysaccharide transport system permease protein
MGRRVRDVLWTLSASDLRVRYGRGPWRLLKWIADPFALVGVYLVLVSVVLNRPGPAPGLSLACAVVPFQVLMMALVNSMDSFRLRSPIISNMAFPRMLLPIASTLTESVAFGTSLLLLGLMMAVYGVAPTTAALWLPTVIATNLIFAAALAYPVGLMALWMPDLRAMIVSFIRTLFFVAPGLIALSQIHGTAGKLVRLNPLTGLFEAYRDALLYGHSPSAWMLLWPLAVAALAAGIFVPIYRREQAQLPKVVY